MSRDFTSWADTIGLWVFFFLLFLIAILIINPITIGKAIYYVLHLFS